jgi:hypothetical protein
MERDMPELAAVLARTEGIAARLGAFYDDELAAARAKDVAALAALGPRRRQSAADAEALAAAAARIAALARDADEAGAAAGARFVRACETLRARAQESQAHTARLRAAAREGLQALARVRKLCSGGRPAVTGSLLDREG